MDNKTSKVMFALLCSAICGDPLSDEKKALYNAEMLPQIATVAKQHDALHPVSYTHLDVYKRQV